MKEIQHISENCDHCQRYRRQRTVPKSSLLSPGSVNEIVCMDLKKLSTGHIMFHAIDPFSRFSSTTIIEDKNREHHYKCVVLILDFNIRETQHAIY